MSIKNKLEVKKLRRLIKQVHQNLIQQTLKEQQTQNPEAHHYHRGCKGPNFLNQAKRDLIAEYPLVEDKQEWLERTSRSLKRMVNNGN